MLALYFIVQVVFIFLSDMPPFGDSLTYINRAIEVAAQGVPYPQADEVYARYIAYPGWINYMGVLLSLTGSVKSIFISNAIFNTGCAFFLYRLTKKLTGSISVSLISLALYMLNVARIGDTAMGMSEITASFFMLAGIFYALEEKKSYLLAAGVMFALCNWMRPFMAFIVPLFIFLLIIRQYDLRRLLIVASGAAMIIISIGLSTKSRTGYFIYQATTGWSNVLMGSWDGADGLYNAAVFEKGNPGYIDPAERLDYKAINEIFKERAVNYAINNPGHMLRQIPRRFAALYLTDSWGVVGFANQTPLDMHLSLPNSIRSFRQIPVYAMLSVFNQIIYMIIVLAFALGCVRAVRHRQANIYIPLFMVIYGSLLTLGVVIINRYHHPFLIFMMIVAASQIRHILRIYTPPGIRTSTPYLSNL